MPFAATLVVSFSCPREARHDERRSSRRHTEFFGVAPARSALFPVALPVDLDKPNRDRHHAPEMGADAFIAFYGVKFTLTQDEADACEEGSENRIKRARKARLDYVFDRLTDGEPYFLYVGASLAALGVEADSYTHVTEAELHSQVTETRVKLLAAGFTETPTFHFQLVAQY